MDITCLTCTMYRDATILVGSQVKSIDGIFDSIRFVSFSFRSSKMYESHHFNFFDLYLFSCASHQQTIYPPLYSICSIVLKKIHQIKSIHYESY
jgi:hypothetical protein